MRDQHRDKRDLINELTGLRKQVTDLKQAAVERRRVEDSLRSSQEMQRAVLDAVPAGLCLVSSDAQPVLANRALARLLGFASPGELVRIGREVGLLYGQKDSAWLDQPTNGETTLELTFRRKDGSGLATTTLMADCGIATGRVLMVVDPVRGAAPDPSAPMGNGT